jgi:alanine-glyoxylate transaminase/serine-glyoxylate transaminase/serine-pyruvate transaminase
MGIEFVVAEKYRLPQLNAVHVPAGVDEKEVRRRLLADYSLEIGAGLGDFAGKVWRFGLMGYSSKIENVMLCLSALENVFSDMGRKTDSGAAESAAHKSYAANPLSLPQQMSLPLHRK